MRLQIEHNKPILNWRSWGMIGLLFVSECVYLLLYSDLMPPILLFVWISLINSLLYLIFSYGIIKQWIPSSRHIIVVVIGFGILLRLSLLFSEPVASDDMYRYIWDGKTQANGIDPYRYAPSDPALFYLHSDMLPKQINYPDMKTIYPPFAQRIFWLSYVLGGESIFAFKIPLLAAEIVTILLLLFIFRRMHIPEIFIALYALCPLPIMQFMVDGHVDAIAFPFLLLFLLLLLKSKRLIPFGSLGVAMTAKLFPGIFLPLAVKEIGGVRRIAALMIPLGVLGFSYLPYLSHDSHPFESLSIFSSTWEFNGSLFKIIYTFIHNNELVRVIAFLLFLTWIGYLYHSKYALHDKLYLVILGFFLISPTVHPWYLTWLALFLPFHFRWSGMLFITLINLANIVVIQYQLKGIWEESSWIVIAEYIPVYAAVAFETLRKNRKFAVYD